MTEPAEVITAAGGSAATPRDPPPVGRRFLRWNLGALAVAVVALVAAVQAPPAPASGTPARSSFTDALWDDGKAEVARYDAERTVYGKPQPYELVTVTVKELHDPVTHTKPNEPRGGAVDAIKLVRIEDVPSGRAYRYRQTLTLHVTRATPERLLGAACGSQEWCGNSFAQVFARDGALAFHAHSYFDGEGERSATLPAGTLLEDQLPLVLRAELGATREVSLLPTLVSNHHPAPAPIPAKITLEPEEPLSTPAGPFSCSRVRVTWDQAWTTLWIAREAPHLLVRGESSDGRKQLLRSVERTIYWKD